MHMRVLFEFLFYMYRKCDTFYVWEGIFVFFAKANIPSLLHDKRCNYLHMMTEV